MEIGYETKTYVLRKSLNAIFYKNFLDYSGSKKMHKMEIGQIYKIHSLYKFYLK